MTEPHGHQGRNNHVSQTKDQRRRRGDGPRRQAALVGGRRARHRGLCRVASPRGAHGGDAVAAGPGGGAGGADDHSVDGQRGAVPPAVFLPDRRGPLRVSPARTPGAGRSRHAEPCGRHAQRHELAAVRATGRRGVSLARLRGEGNRRRWRRWRRRSAPDAQRENLSRPVQAVAGIQGRRRGRARVVWRDGGREGCGRGFRYTEVIYLHYCNDEIIMLILFNLLILPVCAAAYIVLNHVLVTWLMKNYKYTSKRASKKLHSALKIIPIWKINLYTLAQIYGLYDNSVKNPGDVYSLAVNVTLYALFVALILINIVTSYFPRYSEKIQSIAILWTLASILFLFVCSSAGSEWLAHIFPFSPSSIKYASAAATFLVASSILGAFFLLTALVVEFFILLYAALPTAKKYRNTNNISVVLFFIALIASTLSLGIYIPNYAKNNFSTLLVSRIAFDLDSISTQLCLCQTDLDEI